MIVAFVLVLAVAGSAAGQVLQDSFGIPFAAGVGLMLAIVVTFNYIGREWIERTLTAWGLLMSVLLIVYTVLVFRYQGGSIAAALAAAELEPGWWRSGVRFFLYTAMIIPVLLYATDHIETRAQAWGAGLIGGVLGTLPAVLYHLTFMAGYPEILNEALPTYWTLLRLALPAAVVVYVIVLFVTIAQTGVGILQGINERLDAWWRERSGRTLEPAAARHDSGVRGVAEPAPVELRHRCPGRPGVRHPCLVRNLPVRGAGDDDRRLAAVRFPMSPRGLAYPLTDAETSPERGDGHAGYNEQPLRRGFDTRVFRPGARQGPRQGFPAVPGGQGDLSRVLRDVPAPGRAACRRRHSMRAISCPPSFPTPRRGWRPGSPSLTWARSGHR